VPSSLERGISSAPRKVDVRLPGKGDSNSHGARLVHLIITMIKWIRTRRLSIKNSLSDKHLKQVEECLAKGMNATIPKPINNDQLLEKLFRLTATAAGLEGMHPPGVPRS